MSTHTIDAIADQLDETADALRSAWTELPNLPKPPEYTTLSALPNATRERLRRRFDEHVDRYQKIKKMRKLTLRIHENKAGDLLVRAIGEGAFPEDPCIGFLWRFLNGEWIPMPEPSSGDVFDAWAEALAVWSNQFIPQGDPRHLPSVLFKLVMFWLLPRRIEGFQYRGVKPIDHVDAMRTLAGELRRSTGEATKPDAPADADERPLLTPLQRLALDVIGDHRPKDDGLNAAEIVRLLKLEKGRPCEVSTLTTHVLPILKQYYGVMAKGPGYYRP